MDEISNDSSDGKPIVVSPKGFPLMDQIQSIGDFYVRYHVEMLLMNKKLNAKILTKDAIDLLKEAKTPAQREAAIAFLDKAAHQKPNWRDLQKQLNEVLELPPDNDIKEMVSIPRVLVETNGEVCLLRARMDRTNRMLRKFGKISDRFLRVDFKRELKEDRVEYAKKRKARTLNNGLMIAGRYYEFLLASDSGLKWSKAWFFAPDGNLTCDAVRDSLGDFSKIASPYKYCARLGLSLSVSIPTIQIPDDVVEVIPDILRTTDGVQYCFSDGCGQISAEFAKRISEVLKLEYIPSAYQIRYKGMKGVLAINPKLPENGVHIRVRKSMIKFDSDFKTLEILYVSRPASGFLERQKVLILSYLGIPEETFIEAQRETIDELLSSIQAPIRGETLLEDNDLLQPIIVKAVESGYDVTKEAFLSRILSSACYRKLRLIEKKSAFPLPIRKARTALGVVDETGKLQYGQVFFQYSAMKAGVKHGSSTTICDQRVIVGKSPSLHPGDVRVLQCVDVPELHHLVDVVVFPQNGPRPHPNESAGGDLDGDTFLISWFERIIPAKHIPAADYGSFKYEDASTVDIATHELERMKAVREIFVNYEFIDITGDIYNSWCAYADELGLGSKECEQLEDAFKTAVKSTKHGVAAGITYPHATSYPHYMYTKPSRKSNTVLGKLYDEAERLCDSLYKPVTDLISLDIKVVSVFQMEERKDTKACIERQREVFQSYVEEVYNFVKSIDYHDFPDLFDGESYYPKIRRKYQLIFEHEQASHKISATQLASLWYQIAYHEASQELAKKKPKMDVLIILSFPWTVSDIMNQIKRQ